MIYFLMVGFSFVMVFWLGFACGVDGVMVYFLVGFSFVMMFWLGFACGVYTEFYLARRDRREAIARVSQ